MVTPFIVLALPRSRTKWLAGFLSYGDWICGHDELLRMASLEDIATWFKQPDIGTVETAAAPFWRLLGRFAPGARVVTVRRPVEAVLDALVRQGVGSETVEAMIRACDRKLDQIEARVPGVLSVRYAALGSEKGCARVFEHCLQQRHDSMWWSRWDSYRVSGDLRAQVRYAQAYLPRILKLARAARQRTLRDMERPVVSPEGFTFEEEDIETWWRDSKPLIREHMIRTGQDVDDYKMKNEPMWRLLGQMGYTQVITARSNGKMFGYLVTVLGPSLDAEGETEAMHLPFFVSDDCPSGLGMKMQRAAIERLRTKNVADLLARAGVRGSGPKLGVMYKRLGFEDFGTMHRLRLAEV